jgi:5-methylcytosine-specific restriction endonuclease McrA
MDSAQTLLLTPWYSPHKVISWQDAVCLVWQRKAEVLAEYDETLRSPSIEMKMPAVLRLTTALGQIKRGVKFSRVNVFTRDNFTCQYCLARKQERELNYDHVVPRHQGGKTHWENIVASCYRCNSTKRNRTPEEAGMKLRQRPVRPKTLPLSTVNIDLQKAHPLWKDYLGGVAA